MKTKKLLGMLLALTMVFSMVIIPQAVTVNAAYSDNVLFEYDFEDYEGNAPSGSGEGVTIGNLTKKSATDKLYAKTEPNGNTYLCSDFDKYCENAKKTSWTDVGFSLFFDEDFATEGKYVVSFDVGRRDLAQAYPEDTAFSVRFSGSTSAAVKPFRILAADATSGYFRGYKNQTVIQTGQIAFDMNEVYRVDVVFDLDSKYSENSEHSGVVTAFINGKLLTTREFTADNSGRYGLASKELQFRMEHETRYFDNLKVAKIAENSFEATAEYANNTATINFTESLLTGAEALNANDFTVTNIATGEAVAVATATKTAYDEVTLTFAEGAIKKGFTYNVAFSSDVKNIAGNGVTGTASFALPAEEKTVYKEEFSEFSNSEIVLENYEDLAYNDFRLLANDDWLTSSKWEGKRPFSAVQAIADGTDDKAIRIIRGERPISTETYSDVAVTLPYKVYFEGEVSVEYKIKASSDLNSFFPYLIAKKKASAYQISGTSSIPTVRFDANRVKYSETTYKHNGSYTEYPKNAAIVVDADRTAPEYHTYKTVYNFDTEKADIYFDGTKLNTAPLAITNYYHTSNSKADGTPAYIKDVGYFDRIDMRLYGTDNSAYVDIDYIKVTQTSVAPYVKGITYKDYNGNAATATTAGIKEIAVSFGGNVSEASLEKITILDGATPVKYEGAFDAATRTYTMTIPGLLAGGKTYTLDLAAVADPYGAAIVGEKEFTIATAAGTKEPLTVTFSKAKAEIVAGEKVVITATIIDTTGACAENYALIGAVNNGGTLSNVDLATLTWDGFVGTAKANITVESTDELSIKAFVLESLATLAPVAGSPFELN